MNHFSIQSSYYPSLLSKIIPAPQSLYYKGNLDLLQAQCIAVVGPRKSSMYGKKNCKDFVSALVEAGFCIVSGLAIGIDSIAHRTALEKGGETIAVLGGGIDIAYPHSNYKLYQQILSKGLVLSEYPSGTPGFKFHFPERNRIISGLSIATLVVEARIKSGSLITANLAFEQNREVYAVPGSVFDSTNEGVHKLIASNKAKLIHSPGHLLEELSASSQLTIPFGTRPKAPSLEPEESAVIDLLRSSPKTAEQLAQEQNKPLQKIITILTELELKELIQKNGGARYQAI